MQVRRVESKPNDRSNAGMIFVKLYEHCRSYLNILDRGIFFLSLVLTFTTFWVNSADDKLEISIPQKNRIYIPCKLSITVKPQWLEHLWDHGNSFETWIVRATEG